MLRTIITAIYFLFLSLPVDAQCGAPSGPFTIYSGMTSAGIPATISGDINIDGNLIVDDATTFNAADVMVDAGYSITVQSGHTLTVHDGYFTSDGQGMWEGIIVEPGGTLIFDATICHANIAVDSRGTGTTVGDFDITKSTFLNNQIGVRVSNYNAVGASHPGEFRGTTIEGGPLLSDATTAFSVIGIRIDKVNNGVQGFELAGGTGNTFRSLDIGLDISNSIVLMNNNRFEDCQDINGLGLGYGVLSSASEFESDIFMQSSPLLENNEFDGCRYGVALNGLRDIELIGLEMTNMLGLHEGGIRVQNTIPGGSISIKKCTIELFKDVGIRLDDNSGTVALPVVAEIEENTISTFTTSAQVRTGIYVEEPTTGSHLDLTINNENDISGVQIGIYTSNVTDALIENNDVTFNLPAGAPDDAIGIFCVQCEGAIVRENEVTGNCLAPCTYNSTNIRIRGIAMNNCPSAELQTNLVDECGVGALIYNDSQNGNAVCNSFDNCGVGFAFEDIGDMGSPYGPVEGLLPTSGSDNSWTPAGLVYQTVTIGDSDGSLVPWFYRSAPTQYQMISALNTTGGGSAVKIDIQPAVVSSPICDGFMRTDSSDQFVLDEETEHLLDSAIALSSGSALPNWVYSQLESYYQDNVSDAKVLAAIALTNIEQLSDITELINEQEFVFALGSLSTILPINLWEVNKKEVLHLLVIASDSMSSDSTSGEFTTQDFLQLQDYLSSGDFSYLHTMAYADILQEGAAVNIARAMLDLMIIDDMSADAMRLGSHSSQATLKIYPNPSSEVMYLEEYDKLPEEILISSATGEVQAFSWVSHNESQIRIDVSELASGIYYLRLIGSRGNSDFGTFVKW